MRRRGAVFLVLALLWGWKASAEPLDPMGRWPKESGLVPDRLPPTTDPAFQPGQPRTPPLPPGISPYPQITIVEPVNGAVLPTRTPTILISFHDAASGIDPTTLQVFVNGRDVTAHFQVTGSGASFRGQAGSPAREPTGDGPGREALVLREGPNLLIALVKNKAGFPATASSSFLVDLRAPVTPKGVPRSPIELSFLFPPQEPLPSKELPPPEPPSLSRDLVQFGYDQFAQPASTFAPVTDVPVGPDYVLGPGDTLLVSLGGMLNTVLPLPVNQKGEVFLPQVGAVPVWGLSLGQAEVTLREQLQRRFTNFQLSVAMAGLRTVTVFVLGEVARPGSYTLSALSTVTHALFAAGGPTKLGSLRQIRLLRHGRLVETVDLYELLLQGEKRRDVRLASGDTVVVPAIGPVVGIAGAVKRPAIYELHGPTRLRDLLALAGGPLPGADLTRVQVERVEARGRVVLDANLADRSTDLELQDGDLVQVVPLEARVMNAVTLQGFVRRPGRYELKPGMRLSDLLPPEEVLPEAHLDQAEVVRVTFPDLRREVRLVNLRKLFQGDRSQDLELRPLDQIVVRSEGRGTAEVTLEGEVKRPGRYAIIKGERLSSVLKRAGGFTDTAYLPGAVFTRASVRQAEEARLEAFLKAQEQRLLAETTALTAAGLSKDDVAAQQVLLTQRREALRLLASQVVLGRVVLRLEALERFEGSADDLPLEDGDRLMVPTQPSSVLVLGAVRNPTAVAYRAGEPVDYYLQVAGGLTPEAEKKAMHIVKADGSTVSSFLKIRSLDPGDLIVVPPKLEAKPRTLPLLKDLATIAGQFLLSIASLAALAAL